ncbi:enoyl-CoA hydratase/isomerase family protein [Hydrogenophaga sp.]|uniref:enoyl-CoA hydratase/isomerase family protein n=1 Tax=Hydrogenophaga sp. TaxID=1904254 RepID=UPI00272622E2|nr:enoyl-CoA hydratase/isomerase family protein [Hydrogenophaga sp.]MDO9434675.1 enoyl-CoA hydratase/isomerase family protein [Hydrogenophaga sp.]
MPAGAAIPVDAVRVDDLEGGIRVLTIDRPHRMNALDPASAYALADALRDAQLNTALRVIVLTGAGGNFCTGADLKHRKQPGEESVLRPLQICCEALLSGPLPCIAAVDGAAFGAGLSLALACDRIVAADTARFCAPFTGIALVPDVGMVRTLPRRVGASRAREWMIEGTVVGAAAALQHGLADELASGVPALQAATERARRWADRAPMAIAALKRLEVHESDAWATLFARERTEQAALTASADFAEAVAAFRERRPARFKGS